MFLFFSVRPSARKRADSPRTVQGTGTSGALPSVACLTSAERGCHCCRSTLEGSTDPLGRKNVRRNTSAVLRIRDSATQAAEEKTILIDVSRAKRREVSTAQRDECVLTLLPLVAR